MTRISVEYISEGISFSFESGSMEIEDRDGCIRLGFPKRIAKSERRRFFRARPLQLFEVTLNTEDIAEKCTVIDISAGGLSFLTDRGNDRLAAGMEIKGLAFTIADGYVIKVNGILRSRIPMDESSRNRSYRCGVEFVGISESVQERIVRHLFNIQKEEIKRRREDK